MPLTKTKTFLKSKFTKGFTLVEVLVVIAIIAILTSIAYASLNQIRAKSRDQKRIADIHEISLELEYYFNKNGQYPQMLWPTDINNTTQQNLSLYGYLNSEPKAPLKDEKYYYIPLSKTEGGTRCYSYHLYTLLELKTSDFDSRKAFKSLDIPVCGSYVSKDLEINAANAYNTNRLIYDLYR
jgi:prepilin-type N-terminal cleavage/methylation domain-containing protein